MAATTAIDKQITSFLLQLTPKQKKAVLGVVKTFAEEETNAWNDDDYSKEMNKRFAEYETGKVKGYSLSETEARARQAYQVKKNK